MSSVQLSFSDRLLLWLSKNHWLSTANIYLKRIGFDLLVLTFSRPGMNRQAEFNPVRTVPSLLDVCDSKGLDRATVECETSRGRSYQRP